MCNCGGTVTVSTRGQRGKDGTACYRIITANADDTPNVYVSNNNPNILAYDDNTIYEVIIETTNIDGPATLNINGFGALPLQKGKIGFEHDMLANEIEAGEVIRVLLQNNIFLLIQRFEEEMRFSNALYVDLVYGDDTYAEPFNREKPYKTVTAAQSAAVSGNTIIVSAGTDTTGNYGKTGVNYHFLEGYIYNGASGWFSDVITTTSVTCKISGYAVGTNGSIISLTGAGSNTSKYVISIRSWSSSTLAVVCNNGANLDLNVIETITSHAVRAINFNSNNAGATSTLNLTARAIYSSAPVLLNANSNTLYANIQADLYMDPSYGGATTLGAIQLHGTNVGVIYHRGNIYVKPGVSANDPILGSNNNSLTTFVSYSDIISTGLQPIFGFGSNGGGTTRVFQYGVRHYGNVTHSGQLIYFDSNSSCTIELNGEYTTNLDSSMNYPCIQANLDATSIIQINGMIKNSHNDTGAHVIKKYGATGGDWNCKILQGSRLIATNSSVYCITADTYYTYKVYPGAASNVIADPIASTQVISNILVDTNVD